MGVRIQVGSNHSLFPARTSRGWTAFILSAPNERILVTPHCLQTKAVQPEVPFEVFTLALAYTYNCIF